MDDGKVLYYALFLKSVPQKTTYYNMLLEVQSLTLYTRTLEFHSVGGMEIDLSDIFHQYKQMKSNIQLVRTLLAFSVTHIYLCSDNG